MLAYKEEIETKQTYYCDGCGETFDVKTQPFRSETAYYHDADQIVAGHDGTGDTHCTYVYLNGPGSKENVWFCWDDCFHHDEGSEPPISEAPAVSAWICGSCETRYEVDEYGEDEAEREAVECCKDDD